jgi:C1A family cysteine protease
LRRLIQGRGLGWKPDLPDHRDRRFGKTMALSPASELPVRVEWTSLEKPVDHQGSQGSCVAHSAGAAFEMLRAKDFHGGDPSVTMNASRAFIYYESRELEGTEDQDPGCMIRSAVSVVARQGVPTEESFPYDPAVYDVAPPFPVVEEASQYQVTSYLKLEPTNLEELLNCIADGYPFTIGMSVFESFDTDEVQETGVVPIPEPGEQMLGGHAMLTVGYDQEAKLFLVRNSWGTEWGVNGHCSIPFEYMTNGLYASDFWTLRAIES